MCIPQHTIDGLRAQNKIGDLYIISDNADMICSKKTNIFKKVTRTAKKIFLITVGQSIVQNFN